MSQIEAAISFKEPHVRRSHKKRGRQMAAKLVASINGLGYVWACSATAVSAVACVKVHDRPFEVPVTGKGQQIDS